MSVYPTARQFIAQAIQSLQARFRQTPAGEGAHAQTDSGYFSPAKVTRHYVAGLVILAACVLANFVVMQIALAFEQKQVRISALAAEQSRLFSEIGIYSRSLMSVAVTKNAPETSINALRQHMREAGAKLRNNMDELLRLDREPVAGIFHAEVITPYYRDPPHNLADKITRYLDRTNELADLSTDHLAIRIHQWVPMDIAVTTGSVIQNSFDKAMRGAYAASRRNVGTMRTIEKSITLITLLILLFEGFYLFAPLIEALQAQARRDRLTGLANRTLFYERLERSLHTAKAKDRQGVLVLFDLDRFKPINDTLGHIAGDALLQEIARRANAVVGEDGFVARLGGDEFAIIPDASVTPENVEELLRDLARALEQPLLFGEWEMQPAASFGAAFFPEHGEDSERLFAAADAALCEAKRQRSVYLVYDDAMRAADDETRELTRALKQAVVEHQLCVYYQPQMRLRDNSCVGFEALLRWRHPTRGVLSAGQFVHLAQRLGLVPAITAQIVETVCADIRRWLDEGLDPGLVGINMPEEMFATDLAQRMLEASLSRHNVPYSRICVEVTEDVFLNRAADQISDRLADMRALGMRISFDDFGTGYASLSHLKQFPFDELKIDRSFVADLTGDVRSIEIIRALTSLARNLGKSVIAEGIETDEQRVVLMSEGCAVGQGFLYSPALPFEAASAFAQPLGSGDSESEAVVAEFPLRRGGRDTTAKVSG